MSLTVETGSGLSNADSFASVADCDTHNTDYVNSSVWTASSTGEKEIALRTATRYLMLKYSQRWNGTQKTDTQSLPFPREDLYVNGFLFSSTAVPVGIVRATCELAIIARSETLMPTEDSASIITEESVKVGPIEESIKYASGKVVTKNYPVSSGYVADYISAGGRVDRA